MGDMDGYSVVEDAHGKILYFARCAECFAYIDPMDLPKHEEWHRTGRLTDTGAGMNR